jgi:HK97 family phage major capsid protein
LKEVSTLRNDEIRDLREHRTRIHKQMLELNEKASEEKRDLSAEEAESFDKMATEFEELEHRIRRSAQLAGMGRELEEEKHKVFLPEGKPAPSNLAEYRAQSGNIKVWDEPEYRQAFYHYLTAKNPSTDLEIEEHRVLSRATAGAGGNLVPTDMYDQIIRSLRFQGSIASLATTITTASGEPLNIPSNTTHGSATWTAENVGFTASDEVFGTAQLNAYKAATQVIVSEELLEDSAFPLDSFLATEFGERTAVLEETAYVIGDDTGKPQGLLATDATANITLATAAVGNSTSFTYSALVTAVFTLPYQYRQNASFIVNDGTARNLYLMLDSQNRPLWNVNVATTGPDMFLGYPIYTHPDVPAPAISKISLLFGDWKKAYIIRRVDGYHMQRQMELYSNTGQIGFRGWERVDGGVVLAAAGIALKHSAT